MLRLFKSGIFVLCGLAVLAILSLDVIIGPFNVTGSSENHASLSSAKALLGDNDPRFMILPNGTGVTKTFVRKLYIKRAFSAYHQNKRFLCPTEEGLNFLTYLCKQELPLRGHHEGSDSLNRGRYRELLQCFSEINSVFASRLNKKEGSKKFSGVSENSRLTRKELWSKEPYLTRRKDLQDRCNEKALENNIDLTRFVYDDNLKTIMCVVPKAACTTWKRYILYLKGKVSKQNIEKIRHNRLTLNSGYMDVLSSLPKVEAMKRLLTYTSFFVARHPFERLVSAHSSKFTPRSPYKLYQRSIGREIALHQAKGYLKGLKYVYRKRAGAILLKNRAFLELDPSEQEAALQYIEVMNTGNISFHQFAKHVSTNMNNSINSDVHWRPQTDLCNPCAVNYDFVVRFETLPQDSNWLLEHLQRDRPEHEKIFFDTNRTALINWSQTVEAFEGLDNRTITSLKDFYANDFKILNYSFTQQDYYSKKSNL